jgi:hypothetical protein
MGLDGALDVGRRDVLAAGGDDDVLFAACEVQEALLVETTQIARVQPSVLERRLRGRFVLCIAGHNYV